jgi:carbon monoxide dehydrogenase subunit G
MDISGNQKIAAPREKVFTALFDPEVIKNSVPGCDNATITDIPTGRQLKLVLTTSIPGLKGPYNVLLQTTELVAPSHVVLITSPDSSIGSVQATCTVDLSDDPAGTNLSYSAHADLSGKVGAIPEVIMKPAIKSGLDKFFSNLEKQVSTK